MRKLAACSLLVLYTLVTMASALNMHYCAGGWMTAFNTMQVHDTDHCMACQGHHDKDCCKHPKIRIKISHDQLPSGTYTVTVLSFVYVPPAILPPVQKDYFCSNLITLPPAHSPPRWFATANTRQAFYGIFLI